MGLRSWILVLAAHLGFAAFGLSKADLLKEMEPRIAACIARKDTSHPVFHGCFDWHSAAHGHWALFRIARALGTTSPFTLQAERSLSQKALLAEQKKLAWDLKFENPYGRAWFLRLAIDFERWADQERVPGAARLRPLAEMISSGIRTYFKSHPVTPSTPEYQNPSWAFYQLYAYSDFVGDSAAKAGVEAVIQSRFLDAKDNLTFAESQTGFFSLFGNWAFLVAKTQPGPTLEDFLDARPVQPSQLGVYPATTSHSMGLTWSRAWAFSALARTTTDSKLRAELETAFLTHVGHGMKIHAKYKDDYRAYGHWVPQFAVYALTEVLD